MTPTMTGIYAVAFHPAGDQMATAGFDGIVRLLDANDGTLTAEFVSVPLQGPAWIEASAGIDRAAAVEAGATGEDEGSDL